MIDFNGLFPIFNITKVQELSLASTSVLNSNAGTSITLNPMEIKTYQLTVQPGNYGNQNSGATPPPTSPIATTINSSPPTATSNSLPSSVGTTATKSASKITSNILINLGLVLMILMRFN
uniref:Uncharacterized protein n=1 Tax=Acrobeloides nanus TaxID=290746 RepID=A0A914E588_9BILA